MSRRIGFLRAVNVGRRTVPMGRLVEIVEGLGHTDVWTYVNSGNVVFAATGSRASVESSLGAALEAAFGFEITTFVRTAAELRRIVELDPFTLSEGDTYFVTFLKAAPTSAVAAQLEAASNDFDTLLVHGREVHWRMRGRSTETTLGRKTWNLVGENGSTSRNITMLRKLVAKVDG